VKFTSVNSTHSIRRWEGEDGLCCITAYDRTTGAYQAWKINHVWVAVYLRDEFFFKTNEFHNVRNVFINWTWAIHKV